MVDANTTLSTRRRYIQLAGGAAAVGLAGCFGGGDDGGSADGAGEDGTGNESTDGAGNGEDATAGDDGQTTDWVMGTSEQGSGSFSAGQAIQGVIRERSDRLRVSAQASQGHVANAREIGSSYDLATLSNYLHVNAVEETGPFADRPPERPAHVGFSYTSSECFVATHADNDDIETYDDLAGRTITTFGSGSALFPMTQSVFEALGINEDVDRREIALADYGSAMENRRIEACGVYSLLGGTSASGAMQELENRVDLKPVTMSDEERERLADLQAPEIVDHSPEVYEWADEVTAWVDTANVVFAGSADADLVYHATETCHGHWDAVRDAYGGVLPAEDDLFVSGILPQLPVHPGAADYLEEQGLWNDEWTRGDA